MFREEATSIFMRVLCNKLLTLYSISAIPLHGGLMVSALDSGASGPGSSPGRGQCVVFLGKTLYSHSASLHPGVFQLYHCTVASWLVRSKASLLQGYSTPLNSLVPFISLGGERHCESKVSCPRTQHNVPSQGSNCST